MTPRALIFCGLVSAAMWVMIAILIWAVVK